MLSFGLICLLLGLGYWLRCKLRLMELLFLPASVIAGLLGLVLIQVARGYGLDDEIGVCTAGWGKLPGMLINIVFACLFLGKALPKISTVWKSASRQLAYGQIVAWGQYAVGCAFVLLLLKPLFGVSDIFAGIMPVGFEGGHGTAGGMGPVFDDLGFSELKDFALAAATGGILGAIIVGMALVNWAKRKGFLNSGDQTSVIVSSGVVAAEEDEVSSVISASIIDRLSVQLVFVGSAILLGWLMQQVFMFVGNSLAGNAQQVLKSFPLFPLCMLGGVIVQACVDRFDRSGQVDEQLMNRVQHCALDFLVVAAIALIRVDVVAKGIVPLLILIAAGIIWNVLCLTLLARRVFKDAWFERAIAEMGQSMGVTATGLLLLRVVDPKYETKAAEAFACKQLFHEPFMGGGLWTGVAIPLLAIWGGWRVFGIALGAMLLWSFFLIVMNKRRT